MRKHAFRICENKDADQMRGYKTAKLISTSIFTTLIVQSLYFLNLKFQIGLEPQPLAPESETLLLSHLAPPNRNGV